MQVSQSSWLKALLYPLSILCWGVVLVFVIGLTTSPAKETAVNVITAVFAGMSALAGYLLWPKYRPTKYLDQGAGGTVRNDLAVLEAQRQAVNDSPEMGGLPGGATDRKSSSTPPEQVRVNSPPGRGRPPKGFLQPGEHVEYTVYLDQVLQPGEHVEYTTRLHLIVFLPGLLTVAVGIAGTVETKSSGLLVLLIALGLFLLSVEWVKRHTTEIAVSDRRVIWKTGLIRRDTIEMNRNEIESVKVSQSVFGRLLNYGTVTVRGTGLGIEPIRNIEAPLTFRGFLTAH